jgi:hypothetical protein
VYPRGHKEYFSAFSTKTPIFAGGGVAMASETSVLASKLKVLCGFVTLHGVLCSV